MGTLARRLLHISGLFITLLVPGYLLSTPASASTYYISPSGSDSYPGTASQPWRTWANALKRLSPGDTLLARNGTYDANAGTGFPNIDCASGYRNGTSSQPITVRAENERQAFIKNNGQAAQSSFVLRNCSYWTIQGLRIENGDYNDGTRDNGNVVSISYANRIILQRLLVQKPNRYRNSHAISLSSTQNSLVEETEVYSYHRHGIILRGGSSYNVVRRCYVNSRNYADIGGGYVSVQQETGDSAIINYPGSNNIIENNIAEVTYIAFETIAASQSSANNRFLGNIARSVSVGLHLTPQDPFSGYYVSSNTAENMVVVGATNVGIYARSGMNNRCDNCTVIDGNTTGIMADQYSSAPPSNFSFYSSNSLAFNNMNGSGFIMKNQGSFALDFPNSYRNKTLFSPDASSSQITNEKMTDPQMGSCKVFVPSTSPMKKVGKSGKDIGASVLFRYANGSLTSTPLWDPRTGAFPCGALVSGVNNVSGSSCYDVHTRLNVQTNGCLLPAGYGQGGVVAAPANLRAVNP